MSITGIIKKNYKDDNYNFQGSKYISMKNVEDVEAKKAEVIADYKEKLSFNEKSSKVKISEKEGRYTAYYTLFLNAEDIDERVKKQIAIVGANGLATAIDPTTKKIDNVSSPIIAPEGVGGILRNNFQPQKLEEDTQQMKIKGNLISSNQTINGEEKTKKLLAVKIPVMGRNNTPYSEGTINKLKEILADLGLSAKTTTYEGKTSLVTYVQLAKNQVLKDFEDTLTDKGNYVEMVINVSGMIKGGTQYIKSASKIEKKAKTQENTQEEAPAQEAPKASNPKRPDINF